LSPEAFDGKLYELSPRASLETVAPHPTLDARLTRT
jgi:hypothetical protein